MRQYQPIWELIKKDSTASLVADPALHLRIIKAVRKEKDKDLGWKLLLSEQGNKYKLLEEITNWTIRFYLVDASRMSINDL